MAPRRRQIVLKLLACLGLAAEADRIMDALAEQPALGEQISDNDGVDGAREMLSRNLAASWSMEVRWDAEKV